MKKLTIGFDLDSTLNNFEEEWITRYNLMYEDELDTEDITLWNPSTLVKPECGDKIHEIYRERGFFRSLKPRPQSQEVVRFLAKHFNIDVVTSYTDLPESCPEKFDFIRKYFPEIDPENIIFCNDKSKYRGDFLVDDAVHNITGFRGIGVLFDQPWNREAKVPFRVSDWSDVFTFFEHVRHNYRTMKK